MVNVLPQNGEVFKGYKGLNNLLHKTSRGEMPNCTNNPSEAINHCFKVRKINLFRNQLKAHRKRKETIPLTRRPQQTLMEM